MKTTTIRLDDDLMELIDEVANLRGLPSSEIMRNCIRDSLGALADQDDNVREIREGIAQRRIEAQTNATLRKLGMEPTGSRPDKAK